MGLYGPFSAPTSGTSSPVRCDIDPYATAIFIRNTSYTDIFVAFRMTPPPVPLFNTAGVLGGRDYFCVIPARSCGGCLIPQGIYDGSGFPGYFYIYYFNRFGAGGSLGNPLPPPLTGQENSFYIETYVDPTQLPTPYGLTNVADALMIPETGNGVMPGGIALGPDANGDNYAASLVAPPIMPTPLGGGSGFTAVATSAAQTIAAQGANTQIYVFLAYVYLSALPSGATTYKLAFTAGGALSGVQAQWVQPTTGAIAPFVFPLPFPFPVGVNTAVTLTLTNNAGGAVNAAGAIFLFGFSRPV